jgi:hypothetical protein
LVRGSLVCNSRPSRRLCSAFPKIFAPIPQSLSPIDPSLASIRCYPKGRQRLGHSPRPPSSVLAGQQALYYGGAELPEALKASRRSPTGRTPTEDLEIGLITPCGERIARIAAPRDFIDSTSNRCGKSRAIQPVSNAPEDVVPTIGRPTTHGDKSGMLSSKPGRPTTPGTSVFCSYTFPPPLASKLCEPFSADSRPAGSVRVCSGLAAAKPSAESRGPLQSRQNAASRFY